MPAIPQALFKLFVDRLAEFGKIDALGAEPPVVTHNPPSSAAQQMTPLIVGPLETKYNLK
ncbi:hypothetical protein [Rhizobium leguminosarum]|uniref:hypothetical protein n=1 Tax=Rhizobium leguminosarum TaxID=384 RepID=UPI001AED0B0A|nr:hypothetical protein [Rhizobium leguminosarum]